MESDYSGRNVMSQLGRQVFRSFQGDILDEIRGIWE